MANTLEHFLFYLVKEKIYFIVMGQLRYFKIWIFKYKKDIQYKFSMKINNFRYIKVEFKLMTLYFQTRLLIQKLLLPDAWIVKTLRIIDITAYLFIFFLYVWENWPLWITKTFCQPDLRVQSFYIIGDLLQLNFHLAKNGGCNFFWQTYAKTCFRTGLLFSSFTTRSARTGQQEGISSS